ncbi:glycoside hydrolase family 65 protein [Pontibacter sp. SGAir0037]|uniref:glycoside hydrolase family 65 protein n=1 Tax=Pontibacter sp. SGAir0037 TaxID=2571030 RepID=UPI0010CD1A15|nr:glycoside hydrolase family 65 protein [Pontibacter sp. SGAir0037]QCR21885.1 trehalose 6-phosphate phosphorylase [Pontibacter sp. SGAir0037]
METARAEDGAWVIQFDHYDPEDEGRRESLLAIGNGCIVSRAAAPESGDDKIHYPGTYRVGCYNELTSHIQGQEVKNESMVNLPNWLPLSFRVEQGPWFSLEDVTILSYRQTLHLQKSLLSRTVYFSDQQGRRTLLRERRFISMAQPHLMCLSLEITAENWSGNLEIRTGLDGHITNNKVPRYAPYNRHHLEIQQTGSWADNNLELIARTVQSDFTMAFTARTQVKVNGAALTGIASVKPEKEKIFSTMQVFLQKGDKVNIEKIAALYTSINMPAGECRQAAREALLAAPDFNTLLTAHEAAWQQLWHRCQLTMDNQEQLLLFRLHIFHILQNLSPYTAEMDAGVPPSGWQGEEYHGQVFWDEVFIFPFLIFHFPESARSLLHYRYRRLHAARQLAAQHGFAGAMYPWRSASDGEEETPPFQLNPLSGRWMHDYTFLQRHVGAIIAYNIWYYVQITNDLAFLADCGAELFLEIARFWASIATYNKHLDRYEIHGVVGPDEYHTAYQHADKPGISNNSYTNLMAVWTLSHAGALLQLLPEQAQQELLEKLKLTPDELEQWDTISRKMRFVFNSDGTLSQFEGFEELQKFDLYTLRQKHGTERLDWVLESTHDSVQHYQISKQADTPVLLYLFRPEELTALFRRNGYEVKEDLLHRTLEHHLAHTAHESTLSKVVFAGAFAAFDPAVSWTFFKETQQVDISSEDKGTAEGIHMAAMGGTLAVLQHHYLGWQVQDGKLEMHPDLPQALGRVYFSLQFRNKELLCQAERASGAWEKPPVLPEEVASKESSESSI